MSDMHVEDRERVLEEMRKEIGEKKKGEVVEITLGGRSSTAPPEARCGSGGAICPKPHVTPYRKKPNRSPKA
jgi:hypothetical protein